MPNRIRTAIALATLLAASTPVLAQYDKDGRYVPSPGGIPSDPYARPIPTYPGTPGGAIGTPIWPRGPDIAPPPKVLQPPPITSYPSSLPVPFVPLTLEQCDDGWSRATGVSRVEFKRRCALLQKRRK